MRRIILAAFAAGCSQAAWGADIPPPPPAPAPYYKAPLYVPYIWTGFYIGLHGGGASGDKNWTDPTFGNFGSHRAGGWLAGGQIGFNYQVGPAVFGLEAQASGADIKGSHLIPILLFAGETKVDFLGTAAARFGIAFDRVLVYGKAGGAWVHDKYSVRSTVATVAEASDTRWGWMVGVGLEYGITPNWSAKAEYNYMDFGTKGTTFTLVGGGTALIDIKQDMHLVKGGFNYRFGGRY